MSGAGVVVCDWEEDCPRYGPPVLSEQYCGTCAPNMQGLTPHFFCGRLASGTVATGGLTDLQKKNRHDDDGMVSLTATSLGGREGGEISSLPTKEIGEALCDYGVRSLFPQARRDLAQHLAEAGISVDDLRLIAGELEASVRPGVGIGGLLGKALGQSADDLREVVQGAKRMRASRQRRSRQASHDHGEQIRKSNLKVAEESRATDLTYLRQMCYGLSRDGRSHDEIARQCNVNVGVVQEWLQAQEE